MKKLFLTLTAILVFTISSFCEASEASNAKYIHENYVKPSFSLLIEDFLPKMEEVLKNYSTEYQDRAGGDLAYYYRPRFVEIKEKLSNDKKAKDSNIKQLAEAVIQNEIEFIDTFMILRNKGSYNYDSCMAQVKKSISNLRDSVMQYKNEYEVITQEPLPKNNRLFP